MTASFRPRVLICTDWFVPGFKAGGPIRSLDAVVHGLADRFDFDVLTSDRDLGDAAAYQGIEPDRWLDRGPGLRVMYLSPSARTRRRTTEVVRSTPWDCLYLNSMYSIPFTLYPLLAAKGLGKRIVLAPRGMLHPGALKIRPLKKRGFLAAFRIAGLHRHVVFQATAAEEKSHIIRSFGSETTVAVAPNLPSPLPPAMPPLEKRPGSLRIACVARVARNKNLKFLLERLASVQGDVTLAFYGPVEDRPYWQECLDAAARLPAGIRFDACGPVSPELLTQALARSHVFCLPTEGENFGHAIWEALAAGRPPIISDRTPWRRLKDSGAGWDLPLERPDDWEATLASLVEMDDDAWRHHSAAARKLAEDYLRNTDAVGLAALVFHPE
jgi:glycosyltransferase involved in cell wall biosynthesis